MLLFITMLVFSYGSDVDQLISDNNIKFNSETNKFVVTGIDKYNLEQDSTIVSKKDGSAYYQYSTARDGNEALYKKIKNPDGTFMTSRYKIEDGIVRSITECKTVSIPGFIKNSAENRCIYLDHESCSNLDSKSNEVKLLEDGKSKKIDGLVRMDIVFKEGDSKAGKNYRSRQGYKAQVAQRKLSEVFKGETIDVLRRGVEPGEVNMMLQKIKNGCDQITGKRTFLNVPPKAPAAQ